ncbi:hypothetical protein R6Q59_007958 [Mikania micrantha]
MRTKKYDQVYYTPNFAKVNLYYSSSYLYDYINISKQNSNHLFYLFFEKNQMGRLSYTRVRQRSYRTKGFRLQSKRFCVRRLRAKLFSFFRTLVRTWKSRLYRMRSTMTCSKPSDPGSSRRNLVVKTQSARFDVCRLKSFTRTNSFYSEAIADCLEFIKRSSVNLDDM